MRHSFFTQKRFLGVLMVCVLILGIQGVVEAITKIERISPDELSIRVGDPFEIKFSVTFNPRTVLIQEGTQYKLQDGDTVVDRNGYKIGASSLDGKYYILPDSESGLTVPSGSTAVVHSSRQKYRYRSGNTGEEYATTAAEGTYYVDTRGNVQDGRGRSVYLRTGTGMRLARNPAGTVTQQDDPYVYVRWTTTAPTKAPDLERYYYNEEAVQITTNPNLDLRLPNGFPVSGQTLSETGHRDSRLQTTMTLKGVAESVGVYTITIVDATPISDYEVDTLVRTLAELDPREPQITFKVRVSELTAGVGGRVRTTRATESVSNQFKHDFSTNDRPDIDLRIDTIRVPSNTDVIYRITRGSGTLFYSGHTPTTGLTVHKNTNVYINMNGTDNTVEASITGEDHLVKRQTVVFEYIGTDPPVNPTRDLPADTTRTVSVSPISLSGAPGDIREITVSPRTASVTSTSLFRTEGGSVSTTGTVRTVRLPDRPATYRLTFDATNYNPRTISVRVTGEAADEEEDEDDEEPAIRSGTLTITEFGDQVGTQQQINVSASPRPSSDVPFTVSIGGVQVTSGTISTTGRGSALVEVPTTGLYTLTVRASGYTTRSVTFTAGTPTATPPTTPVTPPASTISEPSRVTIGNQATRTGTLDTALETPLLVQVLDDDGNGIADTYVTFRVRTGQGRLSQRGNGRATIVETDARGFARAPYTPLSASSTVEASVRGVARTATFTITTGSAPPATTPTTTPTPGDPTPSTTISPVVQVNAANRPPMLWIDNGAIYALVGANVQRFAPGIDTAMNIAIGGNKVYWTEQTGESAGTINSANLNGSGVKELTAIMAVPRGIVVDTDNSKLYWTNSRGRIQSANLDGSGIRNVLENLPDLIDIAIDRGVLYWTQYNATAGTGNVGILNPTGQRNARYISTGADMPGSIVIGSGKVYWTEQTGTSSGTINAANLNGNSATQLASILAAPSGIAVDASRSKLYWTNSRGRIQSANLDGSGIQNIVDGLGSPADMVISNSITAPTTTSTPTTAANKYDVNGDGTVDVRDSDAVIVAVAAGVTDAKYDVNGDGTVDINDVIAVTANRNGAAGAPTLHGLKFSALEIDRLQEQINLLVATDDRSPAAMRTLIYLQQLIVMARPEKTQLLANYPNPFNPETWIPYELATDTDVRITIYTSTGVVIRTLQFGYQSAGYYTDRERAAYWDGRNAFGEQVASGIYFYQLETDEMSSMRKMVILK